MRSQRIGLLIGLVAAAGCGNSTAPAPTARITGTVTTATSAPQAAVGVDAARQGGSAARRTSTDATGTFVFENIDPGLWTISLDPQTLAPGVLPPQDIEVQALDGQQADASFVLDEVVLAGAYLGTATAQATGAITDTLATLGHPFFPSGPFEMSLLLTPLGGRAFHAQWTGGGREFGGRMVLAGSRVDSVEVSAIDPIPGAGNLECQSPVPNPSVIVLMRDSGTSRARFAGTLVTEWYFDSLGGGLKHETVLIVLDVTHE
jgi:Carboxypeptidase regulatory-like domain